MAARCEAFFIFVLLVPYQYVWWILSVLRELAEEKGLVFFFWFGLCAVCRSSFALPPGVICWVCFVTAVAMSK